MIQRAIISGGGTGGHIFPAIAIAKALKKKNPDCDILFVGANGRMEMTKVPECGFNIIGVDIEGLDRKRIWRNFRVILKYLKAIVSARDIIKDFKPDVCIGVGGYVSAPTLKAAQSLGIPTIIQEQNSYAGIANKNIGRRADKICVAYPDMEKFFPKEKIVLTGNPIRPEIEFMTASKTEAMQYFNINSDKSKIVLIIGGSLGALTINESISAGIEKLIDNSIHIIWQTGKSFYEKAKTISAPFSANVSVYDFISRMDLAYAVSDIVVSRAGASSISELQVLGKPAILVPSPNVAEDHQTKNALALSTRNSAIMVTDKEAKGMLVKKIIELSDNKQEQTILSREISKMAIKESADKIVEEIETIIKNK